MTARTMRRARIATPYGIMAGIILATGLFSAPPSAQAQHAADLLFPGAPGFEILFHSAIQAGMVPPTNTYPIFGSEAMTPLARRSGSSVSLLWAFSTPVLYYDSPAKEGELAANLLSAPSLTGSTFPEIQHYLASVPDPLGVYLSIQPSDNLSAYMEIQARYRRDRIFGTNFSLQWDADEWMGNLFGAVEFPNRAWVAMAGEKSGAAFGRFPSGLGWGRMSGTLLNPRASWYDQARFWLSTGDIRFTGMVVSSSSQLSEAEREIQFRRKADGGSFWDALSDHDAAAADLALKLATWHQVEWRPLNWLSFGIAEMGMIGGRVPALNFVLPSLVWHNTYASGYANVAAAVNAALVPVPGILLSGEFLVDDTRAVDEPAYAKPNSFAWQGALRWDVPIRTKAGLDLDVGIEYQHVDRWTYVRWQPYLSMYQRQTLTGGYYGMDQSLGAPWGPDYDSASLSVRLSTEKRWHAELTYEFVRKGPIHQGMAAQHSVTADFDGDPSTPETIQTIWVPVYYDYEKYAGSGALAAILAKPDEFRNLISLRGSLQLHDKISLETALMFGFYQNFGNVQDASESMLLAHFGVRAGIK